MEGEAHQPTTLGDDTTRTSSTTESVIQNHAGGAANPQSSFFSSPPPISEPATPIPGENDLVKTEQSPMGNPAQSPGIQTPQVPNLQSPTPIQPYYPYHPPLSMPAYAPSAMTSTDPFMTGAGSNPYHYMDVSQVSDPLPDTRRNRGGVSEPFPEKLHRMLEYAEREGLADVVSFFRHGRAFAIHKPKTFVADIMPHFFKQTRLTSFQRQLNLYGFRRISQGPDNGGYYHELFLKGRPGLCVNMKRTKVKGALKLKRDPDTEPNFYAYPPIQPVGTVPPQPSGSEEKAAPSAPNAMYQGYVHPVSGFGGYPVMPGSYPYTSAQLPNRQPNPVYPYPPYGYPGGWMPGQPMPGSANAQLVGPPMVQGDTVPVASASETNGSQTLSDQVVPTHVETV